MYCIKCIHRKVCSKEKEINAECAKCEDFEDISKSQVLPCAVGTKVYIISAKNKVREFRVQGFRFGDVIRSKLEMCIAYSWVSADEIDKTIFFSYEAAKSAVADSHS